MLYRRNITSFLAAVFLVLAVFLPISEAQRAKAAEQPNREWTILIYYDGDNNLEQYMLDDLKEIEKGMGKSGKVEVIGLVDRAKDYTDIMGDWTGTRLYRIKKSVSDDTLSSELLADMGELNMGDPKTLEDFIRTALKKYPSKKVALIMWNHGGGWASMANDNDAPGAPNGIDALDINEFSGVLERTAPLLDGGKFELIAFDMCLMGQADVIAACSPFARYMLAGATVLPAVGMDYLRAIKLFDSSMTTAEIVQNMVDIGCDGFSKIKRESASLSAFDLSKAGNFLSAFKALADKLYTIAPEAWKDITRTAFYSLNYMGLGDYRNGKNSISSVDLLDWLGSMKKMRCGDRLRPELEGLENAAKSMIMRTRSGRNVPSCQGLSFYAPLRASNMDPAYENTYFNRAVGWSKAMGEVHKAQNKYGMKAPEILNIEMGYPVLKEGVTKLKGGSDFEIRPLSEIVPLSTASSTSNEEQSYVKISMEGENILWGYGAFAFYSKERDAYVVCVEQLLPAEDIDEGQQITERGTPVFKDGRNEVIYQIAGMIYAFNNGTESTLICPNYTDVSDGSYFIVNGTYSDKAIGGEVPVIVKIDYDFSIVLSVTGFFKTPDGKTIVSDIIPSPDGVFTPDLTILKDGRMRKISGNGIKWKDGLSLVIEPAPEGSSMLPIAWAESLGGKSSLFIGKPVKVAANHLISSNINTTQNEWRYLLLGRYAVAEAKPLKSGEGFILAPNGGTIEIYEQGSGQEAFLAAHITLSDGTSQDAIMFFDEKGLPVIRLTIKDEDDVLHLLLSFYSVVVKEGPRHVWVLISPYDGSKITWTPLNESWFPRGYLNGEWIAQDGTRLGFQGDAIYFTEGARIRQGRFTLCDNTVRAAFTDGSALSLYTGIDQVAGKLVVTFGESDNAMVYSKVGAASQNPPNQQLSLNGIWGAVVNGGQMLLGLQGNQYQISMNGITTEYGVFQVQGNILYAQSSMGKQFMYYFQLDQSGRFLRLTYQNGQFLDLQRVQ